MLNIKPYTGVLSVEPNKMNALSFRAYTSYRAQKSRCYYKKNNSYKHWGAKKIKVKYNSRDFIGWYIHEYKKHNYKKNDDIVVSRKDHNKNYDFNNIFLSKRSENSREETKRNRLKKSRIIDIYDKQNNYMGRAVGSIEASNITGINKGNISRIIRGLYKNKKYKFRIIKEVIY